MPSNRGLANHLAVSPISDSNELMAGFSATSESNDLMTGSCRSYCAVLLATPKSRFCVMRVPSRPNASMYLPIRCPASTTSFVVEVDREQIDVRRRLERSGDAGSGDLLRPHHAQVVLRLVALVSDVAKHHLHRAADDDLAFNPGHAISCAPDLFPSDPAVSTTGRGKGPRPTSPRHATARTGTRVQGRAIAARHARFLHPAGIPLKPWRLRLWDGAGLGAPAPGRGRLWLWPARFPAPRGRRGLPGQGRPAGPSRAARLAGCGGWRAPCGSCRRVCRW